MSETQHTFFEADTFYSPSIKLFKVNEGKSALQSDTTFGPIGERLGLLQPIREQRECALLWTETMDCSVSSLFLTFSV